MTTTPKRLDEYDVLTCIDCGARITIGARCDDCRNDSKEQQTTSANGHNKLINWLKVLWHRW